MKYICLLLMKPFYLIFNDIINNYSLKTDHFWNKFCPENRDFPIAKTINLYRRLGNEIHLFAINKTFLLNL